MNEEETSGPVSRFVTPTTQVKLSAYSVNGTSKRVVESDDDDEPVIRRRSAIKADKAERLPKDNKESESDDDSFAADSDSDGLSDHERGDRKRRAVDDNESSDDLEDLDLDAADADAEEDDDESSDDATIIRDRASRIGVVVCDVLGIKENKLAVDRPKRTVQLDAARAAKLVVQAATDHLSTFGVDVNRPAPKVSDTRFWTNKHDLLTQRLQKWTAQLEALKSDGGDTDSIETMDSRIQILTEEISDIENALAKEAPMDTVDEPMMDDKVPYDEQEVPTHKLVVDLINTMGRNYGQMQGFLTTLYGNIASVVLGDYNRSGKNATNYRMRLHTFWGEKNSSSPFHHTLCYLIQYLTWKKRRYAYDFMKAVEDAFMSITFIQLHAAMAIVPVGEEDTRFYVCCTCRTQQEPQCKDANSLSEAVPVVHFVQHKMVQSTLSPLQSDAQGERLSTRFVMCKRCSDIQVPLLNALLNVPDQISQLAQVWILTHKDVVNKPGATSQTLLNAFHVWDKRTEHQKALCDAFLGVCAMALS